MRIRYFRIKLLATLFVLASLLVMKLLRVPCVFLTVFHIPCLSCGMTRAYLAALRLDFGSAFRYHPMFWSVPVLYLYVLFDAEPIRNKRINRLALGAIAGGFFLNYCFVLTNWFCN